MKDDLLARLDRCSQFEHCDHSFMIGEAAARIREQAEQIAKLREALRESILVIGDACHATAIYGDQPPEIYLDALDQGVIALRETEATK